MKMGLLPIIVEQEDNLQVSVFKNPTSTRIVLKKSIKLAGGRWSHQQIILNKAEFSAFRRLMKRIELR